MFQTFFLLVVFVFKEVSAIHGLPDLPSPRNIDIAIYNVEGSKLKAARVVFKYDLDYAKTIFIDAALVDKPSGTLEYSLKTKSGLSLGVSNPDRLAFYIEVPQDTPLVESLEAIFKAFSDKHKPYDQLQVFYSIGPESPWSEAITDALIGSNMKVFKATLVGSPPNFSEDKLLQLVKNAGVKDLGIFDPSGAATPARLSDTFFRDPTIVNLNEVIVPNTGINEIKYSTLLGLKAKRVSLGNATAISPMSVRRFLLPVFNSQRKSLSLGLIPTFDLSVPRMFGDLQLVEKSGHEKCQSYRCWSVRNSPVVLMSDERSQVIATTNWHF